MAEESQSTPRPVRRTVDADLIETTPPSGGLFHWILASPMLLFLAWMWVDLFAHYSPLPWYWLDAPLGLALFIAVIVLPFGLGAFHLVATLPRLFGHAGWDVQPLESVREAELPMVRFRYRSRTRAARSWSRTWLRAAQGWVYLEVAAVLIGGVLMVPIFFSAVDFGFGS